MSHRDNEPARFVPAVYAGFNKAEVINYPVLEDHRTSEVSIRHDVHGILIPSPNADPLPHACPNSMSLRADPPWSRDRFQSEDQEQGDDDGDKEFHGVFYFTRGFFSRPVSAHCSSASITAFRSSAS